MGNPKPQSPSSMELTHQDNGKHIIMTSGDELIIHLGANPTTGFDWQDNSPQPSLLAEEDRQYRPLSDAIGSPSELTIHYRASASGNTSLVLKYRRRWEIDVPPIDTFSIGIVIRES